MKTPKLLLSVLACAAVAGSYAQSVPTHDSYVMPFADGKSKPFSEYFRNWEPGTPLSEDENFYIGRVPLKKRFENAQTQVDPSMTTDRKFCMWTPMGISDTYWQSLPRYVFDGDNFNLWSYVDSQGGWSLPWVRVPGAYSDVTHRNGVANSGGIVFFDSWGGNNTESNNTVNMLVEKNGSSFKWVEKFVKFLRYYGLDGVGFNPEGTIPQASALQDFFTQCREYAESIGWQFHVYWYGVNNNNGSMTLAHEYNSSHKDWLWKNNKLVTDMYMLNYDWHYYASSSQSYAESIGANPYDLYAGYDIQGNWLGRGSWTTLSNSKLSIAFWGNHTTNMIYQNSSEFGSGDEAVQNTYLVKQEQVFSGGNRNPANCPPIKNGLTSSSEAAMNEFHGIAKFLPARSVLQELPFVTRFCLGNGKAFRDHGAITFDHKWFNVGVQDYLPTWRWWITDNNKNVPSDAIKCGFTFDDAWFGGSAMRMNGATTVSNVRLFKTKFNVSGDDKVSMTFKLKNGTDTHMKLFWSFVGSENTLHEQAITSTKAGEWETIEAKASEIGMTGDVALIGLKFENTPATYEILIGEMAIIPTKTFNPVKPVITTQENNILKKRSYNSLDFKFSWDCESTKNDADPSIPVYNEDVDTWYFEVYVQAEGEDPILCGTTSSWAHYVVGAPVSTNNEVTKYRVGVCAVAPDGVTKSDITWTNYMTCDLTLIDGIECNKAVIKAGEEFTLSLLDPNQEEPETWEIYNATSGSSPVRSQDYGRTFTTSLTEEGYYDVILTKSDWSEIIYRGYIQISPESTGAIPSITDFTASKTNVTSPDDVVTLSYTGQKGEGTVSRGLRIEDPYMFRIPAEFLPMNQNQYTIALWIKPEKFTYAQHAMGLMGQRDLNISWPHNNWGTFWLDVWPEKYDNAGKKVRDANILSYTMYGGATYVDQIGGGGNRHENPNPNCMTNGYSLSENQWTHVLISYDGSKQRIYFNGKKTGEAEYPKLTYSDLNGGTGTVAEAPIFIGGSRVYYAGFTGTIDDVQVWHKALSDAEVVEAMKGYDGKTIPADLKGYWTFESDNYNEADKTFENKGSLSTTNKAAYVEVRGAGGENTSLNEENLMPANINVEGNPAMSGTLPITTTSTFTIPDVEVANSDDQATVSFNKSGNYDVTLTLANGWGSDTMTKKEYIVVVVPDAIEDNLVNDLKVYPNPFIENVNLQFAADGNYVIDIFDAQGRKVTSKTHQAMAGEICTLTVNEAQGVYYVVISKDGKRVKALKVVAE